MSYTSVDVVVLPVTTIHKIRQSLQVLMDYSCLLGSYPELAEVATLWSGHVQQIAQELDHPTTAFMVSPPPGNSRLC